MYGPDISVIPPTWNVIGHMFSLICCCSDNTSFTDCSLFGHIVRYCLLRWYIFCWFFDVWTYVSADSSLIGHKCRFFFTDLEEISAICFADSHPISTTNHPQPIIHYLICEIYALHVKFSHLCEKHLVRWVGGGGRGAPWAHVFPHEWLLFIYRA